MKVQDGYASYELFRCWTRHCLCCCRFRLSSGAEEGGKVLTGRLKKLKGSIPKGMEPFDCA